MGGAFLGSRVACGRLTYGEAEFLEGSLNGMESEVQMRSVLNSGLNCTGSRRLLKYMYTAKFPGAP